MMREAAMSSMARVIFLVDSTERIRARYSRRDSAMVSSVPLLLDDLLLLELLVGHGVGLGLGTWLDRLALGGLELVQEVVVRRGDLLLGRVVEQAGLTDAVEDVLVLATEVVQELLLEAQHV